MKICQRFRYFPRRGGCKTLWVAYETKSKVKYGWACNVYREEHGCRPLATMKMCHIPGADITYEDYKAWVDYGKSMGVLK